MQNYIKYVYHARKHIRNLIFLFFYFFILLKSSTFAPLFPKAHKKCDGKLSKQFNSINNLILE